MWTNRHTAILGAASVVSLAAGSALGYLLAQRKLEAQFEERLDRELDETRKFYQNIFKGEDPEELARLLVDDETVEAIDDMQKYDTQATEIPQEILDKLRASEEELESEAAPIAPAAEYNAFENPQDDWNLEEQKDERRNGVPYIISHDEFYENEWEFEEGNLIWYEGDSVLADSRDEPIAGETQFVGEEALNKFGFGSNDPNIVYVCNEKMEMIFEICRSSKSFAEDVMGWIDPNKKELKHSARRDFRRGLDE